MRRGNDLAWLASRSSDSLWLAFAFYITFGSRGPEPCFDALVPREGESKIEWLLFCFDASVGTPSDARPVPDLGVVCEADNLYYNSKGAGYKERCREP